nr:serine/arginine repetitive matrix protein 1-like [Aegilops tauschii subsp. strangulata]
MEGGAGREQRAEARTTPGRGEPRRGSAVEHTRGTSVRQRSGIRGTGAQRRARPSARGARRPRRARAQWASVAGTGDEEEGRQRGALTVAVGTRAVVVGEDDGDDPGGEEADRREGGAGEVAAEAGEVAERRGRRVRGEAATATGTGVDVEGVVVSGERGKGSIQAAGSGATGVDRTLAFSPLRHRMKPALAGRVRCHLSPPGSPVPHAHIAARPRAGPPRGPGGALPAHRAAARLAPPAPAPPPPRPRPPPAGRLRAAPRLTPQPVTSSPPPPTPQLASAPRLPAPPFAGDRPDPASRGRIRLTPTSPTTLRRRPAATSPEKPPASPLTSENLDPGVIECSSMS